MEFGISQRFLYSSCKEMDGNEYFVFDRMEKLETLVSVSSDCLLVCCAMSGKQQGVKIRTCKVTPRFGRRIPKV